MQVSKHFWQLYNAQGKPTDGAPKMKVVVTGLLHGVAHVWIWRKRNGMLEVLLQRRAGGKINWPHLTDKSAGGHMYHGEDPLEAAVRKVKEELGVHIEPDDLQLIGVSHWHTQIVNTEMIENEYQWIYAVELDDPTIIADEREIQSVVWKPLKAMRAELANPVQALQYAPYGNYYYGMVIDAIQHSAVEKHVPAH